MAMSENYITPAELRRIADLCESIDPLWEVLTAGPVNGVSVETEEHNSIGFSVYDANGETLGRIAWGDEKGAFYPARSYEGPTA